METYSVGVRELPSVYEIGRKLYAIRTKRHYSFQQTCPVCDGTRKITYRGYEMDCPYCVRVGNSAGTVTSTITVRAFVVEEFIVRSVTISGSDTKADYEPKRRNSIYGQPRIRSVTAFTRRDSSYRGTEEVEVPGGRFLDPDEDLLRKDIELSKILFTKRAKAEEAKRILVEVEKQKLSEFNEKFGCSHEYPEEAAK